MAPGGYVYALPLAIGSRSSYIDRVVANTIAGHFRR